MIVTLHQQCEQIKKLEKLVTSLRQNSTNSSKPPSSDGPETKKKTKKRKSRKKQGGQPGHKGKNRNLPPTEQMDKIHDCYPSQCEECSNHFADDQKKPTDKPARYQWFELPVIKVIMEEFRCHTLTCKCGHRTTASLPKYVAISCFGPRHKNGKRQLCGAHLIRKFKALKENRGSPDSYIFSKNMLKETGRLFTYRHAYLETDGCSLEQLYQATALIQARMKKYCKQYYDSDDKAVRTRARRTLKNLAPSLYLPADRRCGTD